MENLAKLRLILFSGIVALLLIKENVIAAMCGEKEFKCWGSDQRIERSEVCDEKVDCENGIDETYEACIQRINGFRGKSCKLPPKPDNGYYISFLCEDSSCLNGVGSKVQPGFSLHFECNEGYGLKGPTSDIVCMPDGSWNAEPSFCAPTYAPSSSGHCEPLLSTKLLLSCVYDSKLVPCYKPVPDNAYARFRCKSPIYTLVQKAQYSRITCHNGNWDKPLIDHFCQPECGRPAPLLALPQYRFGNETAPEFGQFPWHAAIYRFNPNAFKYEHICGGTLISKKVVVTAAHCVYYSKARDKRIYKTQESALKIALGKYFRDLDAKEDVMAQIMDVESFEKAPDYKGYLALYTEDIAFIVLKTEVEYTMAVRPVCVDTVVDRNNDENQLVRGAIGKVAGWGLNKQGVRSETLLSSEMPYVPQDECVEEVASGLKQFVLKDKICGGDKNLSANVCGHDSGSGYVFEDPRLNKYFLRGVTSLGSKNCRDGFLLFTRVSAFKDLVDKYLNLYKD